MDHQNHLKLVAWLKRSRLEKGMTMRELGNRLNKPFQYISKIERAQQNLHIEDYVKYCNALGVDMGIGLDILSRSNAKTLLI